MVGAPKLGMMAERRSTVMVKRKRQVHTRAFKEQAVALANGSDRTLAAVAKGLGVPSQTLADWVEHPPGDRAAARAWGCGAAGAPAGGPAARASAKEARAAALADERTGDPVALRLQLNEARERIR